MTLKGRVEKAEKRARPNREAFFTIKDGRAAGHALWREGLAWLNLTRPEYDQLVNSLAAEGVKITVVNITIADPAGHIDGWAQQAVEV